MESMQLSAYDFVVLGIFLLFIGRGVWLGLFRQIVPFLALYVGYIVVSRYHQELFPFLDKISDNPRVVFIAAYVILFVATYLVTTLLGRGLAKVIQITITPWFDRILGAVLGFAKAAIVAVLIHMLLGTITAPDNQMLQTCTACPLLNEVTDATRQIIKDENIREALKQQKPAIALDAFKDMLSSKSLSKQEPAQPQEKSTEPDQAPPVE
ncbi:MAG: CvpA family protein [Desulfobacterales bacterium]|nr:CvpA family protein [Deltaproteobacteria bacterium]NNK94310.1 CvpA family protein [Desulfobacterales bacterium]